MLYNTYIDESGNTGNNLVNSTQKYFALAAVSIPQTKEAAITKVFSIADEEVMDALVDESDELAHICELYQCKMAS